MEHETSEERRVVSGIFPDQETATAAVKELADHHFDTRQDISVVLADGGRLEHREVQDKLEYVDGAKIGGGLGAALGATGGGLVAAGVVGGPVGLLAAGPLLTVLQGALAGGAFGTFSGWLVSAGLVNPEADLDDADLESGSVWVAVHAAGERRDEALEVLRKAGAERLSSG